jgi:hypothetical protein
MKTMFKSDLSKVRSNRQKKTNRNLAETVLYTDFTDKDLKKLINFKSLDRLADVYNEDRQYIYDLIKGKREITCYDFALAVAHGTAILASRQGSTDERFVLDELNRVTSEVGIFIQSIGNQDLRPVKSDGRLLTKKEYKNSGLTKLQCLKSIDGTISGKIDGYIFGKICFGEGGHQSNVFHESEEFAKWAHQFGEEDKIYVALIDTDLTKEYNDVKSRHDNGNVWVVDHVEFQQRLGIN